MAAMSDYLENAILNATLRGIAYTPPASVYLALFTSDPTDAETGTEVSGGAYVRKAVVFNVPQSGVSECAFDTIFPVATSGWGTITHIGIMDALSGGNLLYHGPLTNTKTIAVDDQLKVGGGDLSVTLA